MTYLRLTEELIKSVLFIDAGMRINGVAFDPAQRIVSLEIDNNTLPEGVEPFDVLWGTYIEQIAESGERPSELMRVEWGSHDEDDINHCPRCYSTDISNLARYLWCMTCNYVERTESE